MKLTDELLAALAVTHRGLHTIIVRADDLVLQPEHLARKIGRFPELVSLGLMTREDLEPGVTKFSITEAGRRALQDKPE